MHKNIKPNQSETLAEVIQCSEILRIWTYYLSNRILYHSYRSPGQMNNIGIGVLAVS